VDVTVDEAGKDELLAKIDELIAVRRIDEARRDCFNPSAFDQDALLSLGCLGASASNQPACMTLLREDTS
jgi:hypothetical protein